MMAADVSCKDWHDIATHVKCNIMRSDVQAHTTCVTESQKYAEGATKPGGFASKGFFEAGGKPVAAASAADPAADEFLSKRPPWKCRCDLQQIAICDMESRRIQVLWPAVKANHSVVLCSVCNVSCTSQETLHAHASGKRHIRRVGCQYSCAAVRVPCKH